MIEKVKIEEIKLNPENPRIISDVKFNKLVESIKSFPEMLEIRPIVVDGDGVALGGNMRLRACIEAGFKEVYIIRASNLTEDQKLEFIIKDNVGYGEWDWAVLDTEWNNLPLLDWGLDYVGTDWGTLGDIGELEPPVEHKVDKITILLEEDAIEDKSKILEEIKEVMKKWNNYVIK